MDWNFAGAFMAPQAAMNQMGMQRLQAAEGAARLQMLPLEMQRLQAATKLTGAQAESAQLSLDQQRALSGILKTTDFSGMTPEQQMQKIGQAAFATGNYTLGTKMMTQQLDALEKKSQIAKNDAAIKKSAYDMAIHYGENVTDQASLDHFNALWYVTTGTRSPLAGQTYSPTLIKNFTDNILAQQGKQTNADRELKLKIEQEQRQALAEFRRGEQKHWDAMERLAQEREQRLAKSAGNKAKDVGSPTTSESQMGYAMVTQKYPNIPPEQATQAGFTVAALAKSLRKKNPGMDAETAMQRAFQMVDADGDFKTTNHWFGKDSTDYQYNRGGHLDSNNPINLSPNPTGLGESKPAAKAPQPPRVGTVESGYRFRGGNPADPNNWEKVQ